MKSISRNLLFDLAHAAGLYIFGHYVRRAVSAVAVAQKVVGLVVADHLFGGGIELQRATQAIRNVGEVHQGARNMAFLDWGVEVFFLAAPHALNKIRPVISGAFS